MLVFELVAAKPEFSSDLIFITIYIFTTVSVKIVTAKIHKLMHNTSNDIYSENNKACEYCIPQTFFTKVKFYIILLDAVELCSECSDIITLRHRPIGNTKKLLVLTDMRSIL